jgi:N-acetylmuramoyl-L-alanine amidase
MKRQWSHIILHHSLTDDGATVSWQAIRRYHVQEKHWDDIGYHYGIELINGEYEVLVGRDINRVGAHTVTMNQLAIGICFVGNFDVTIPPEAMLKRGVAFVASLCEQHNIMPDNIVGHRFYAPKSCPGNNFDLTSFIERVRASMP